MIRMILLVLMIALLKTPIASAQEDLERGGTLPLRLRSGGTLPLKLNGEAISGPSRVGTQITITRATADALAGNAANAVSCQLAGAEVSKHSAQGTVLVGLAQFTIKGICFDHASQQMEVVAERRGVGNAIEQSFLAGSLVAPEPRSFAGRLVVTGATPPAGNYSFSTRTVEEIIPVPRQ